MRYVRTKNGIYEFQYDNENENTLAKEVVVVKDGELTCLNKRKIVAQADAIEKLCDMFVIVSKANPLIKNFTVHIESAKSYGTEDDDIYGAIWAEGDKGEPILMSVAKMNEEGDLKLL